MAVHIIKNYQRETIPEMTMDRINLARQYLLEIRDLVLRIETLATIEEKSYGAPRLDI